MTPNYILNEIALRVHSAHPRQVEKLARAVGINLTAANEPPPSIFNAALAIVPSKPEDEECIRGAVPFEMKLSALGEESIQTCRAVFSAELVDDFDRRTGEALRILGRVAVTWQILDWRDLDRTDEDTGEHLRAASPAWSEDFEAMLPTAVERLIMDQVEEQACLLEASRQSRP